MPVEITARPDPFHPLVDAGDDGKLYCHLCSSFWCAHIQDVIADGMDADSLFSMASSERPSNDGGDYRGVNDISVPILPTVSIFADVYLSPMFKNDTTTWMGCYQARFILGIPGLTIATGAPIFHWVQSMELGLLNRGEGRLALKKMVVNWFYPEIEADHGKCVSTHHVLSREYNFRQIAKNGDWSKKFTQAWMMAFQRKCLACFQDDPSPKTSWGNEFIPD